MVPVIESKSDHEAGTSKGTDGRYSRELRGLI
jgi:hypothetical protein